MSPINSTPYPFSFDTALVQKPGKPGQLEEQVNLTLKNVRGRIPSVQTSRLRTIILESHADPNKILAHACTYDGLTARLAEEAGFPMVFVSGYAVASANGLPDAGYIALEDMCSKIKETARVVSVPIMVDGDTGYGSPVNVRRTVESFALAGAAGVMIEDQAWPKRCGHTKGKSVVPRGEAYARIKAACDARDQGLDIFILARTDALIHGWDEALARVKEFKRLGADAVFVEALPDRDALARVVKEVQMPIFANIIEGGKTENLSAKELAALGFCGVAYPISLVAAHLVSVREALENLKKSFTEGAPPMIMDFGDVCRGVGFGKYWELEDKYKHDDNVLLAEVNGNGTNGVNGHH